MKILHIVGSDNPKIVKGGAILFKEVSTKLGLRGHKVYIIAASTTLNSKPSYELYSKNVFLIELTRSNLIERLANNIATAFYYNYLPSINKNYKGIIVRILNEYVSIKGLLKPPYYKLSSYYILFKLIDYFDIINTSAIATSNSPYLIRLINIIKSRDKRNNLKFVITPIIHPSMKGWLQPYMIKTLKFAQGIFVSTPYEKVLLNHLGLESNKIFIIGEGVDLQKYESKHRYIHLWNRMKESMKIKDDDKIVLWLGRKSFYKGIYHVLHAFVKLVKKFTNLKLILVGPTDPYDKGYSLLYYRIKKMYPGNIYDLGVISEKEKIALLHNIDVLVLPSIAETIPIAMLEAWACKKPVIVADIPTIKSIINIKGGKRSGKAALLVRFGDVESIKEAINRILLYPELAKEIGLNGYYKVANYFNWDAVVNRVEKAYKFIKES